jgi:gluconate kinase
MVKSQKLLLLTGIPGTGKTSAGEYLAHHHGFAHLEAEVFAGSRSISNRQEWETLWQEFLARADALKKAGKSVVITWGFMPGVDDKTIRSLQAMGFTMVWFDGDRKAARREFLRRGTVPEQLLDVQLKRIATLDLDSLSPIKLDPFDDKGKFLPRETIAEALLAPKQKK